MDDAAIESFRRIVDAFKAGDFAAALAACQRVLETTPADARLLFLAGSAARRLGLTADWTDYFRRTLELDPDNVEAHYERAVGLRILGEAGAARQHFERVLALDPGHAAARHQLAQFRRFAAGDPEIEELRRRLAAPDATAADRVLLGFALAKALEDAGEHAAAFAALQAANAIKRGEIDYDVTRDEAFADRLIRTFTPALAERLGAVDGALGSGEVFVVGMPRAGTTLSEQILAAHGEVAGLGEVLDLEAAANAFAAARGETFPECLQGAGSEDLAALGRDYVARVTARAPDAKVRVNKTPANFLYVGAILLALPGARVVHSRRDPLDTCFSCFATLFEAGPYFANDLEDLARYHNLYAATMAHWRGLFPGRVLELDYEALIAEQETETRRLLDFCGLDWDAACLEFHAARRNVETASNLQVRRPLYKGSVGRAKPYAAGLAPLTAKLKGRLRP
ncbi:MAG: sulfotransferase [Rhodospirillaceae bacterium]